jgi:hypothetical protein
MQVVYARCAGLDVHKKTVSVCVSVCEAGGAEQQQVRVFGTFTRDLLALADWLKGHGVTHIAMEATGVYWRPVWAVLEGQFQQLLVNPQHIKAVPGRKTDAKDCEWIAHLLQHGLLKGSRDLLRHPVEHRVADAGGVEDEVQGGHGAVPADRRMAGARLAGRGSGAAGRLGGVSYHQPAWRAAITRSVSGDQQHRGQSAFRRARAHAPHLPVAAGHGRAMVGGSIFGYREVVPEDHGLPGSVALKAILDGLQPATGQAGGVN